MSVGIMSVVWAKAGQIRPVPTQIICGVLLLEAQVCFELMFLCVCVVVCVWSGKRDLHKLCEQGASKRALRKQVKAQLPLTIGPFFSGYAALL